MWTVKEDAGLTQEPHIIVRTWSKSVCILYSTLLPVHFKNVNCHFYWHHLELKAGYLKAKSDLGLNIAFENQIWIGKIPWPALCLIVNSVMSLA